MADLDELARRAAAGVGELARRGARLAAVVAGAALVVALLSYAVGLAALDGDARDVWRWLGAAFLLVGVGAPLLAWWRLGRVRRQAGELVGEVRRLVQGDDEARRVVIDTFETPERTSPSSPPVIVQYPRQYARFRSLAATSADLRSLPAALTAVVTLPGLLAIGFVVALVFGLLGILFLLIWLV